MKIAKEISITRFFAQVLFLLIPTFFVVSFILWNGSQYLAVMRSQWIEQTFYFGTGMLISFFIYQFRFRFLPLFLSIVILFYFIYKTLDEYAVGEFDSFFILIKFLTFSYLFAIGWLCGWGLQRVRFFPIILSSILFILSIYLISKTGEITVGKLLQTLIPIGVYTIYLIFTNEALYKTENTQGVFWWRFSKRLILFSLFMSFVFSSVIYLMYDEINAKVADYGGNGKEGENQMLKTEKDNTVKNRESMGLGSNNNRNGCPEPILCAHIDSYIPGTDIPNPLYLTSYHFTKYDTTTETFERDSLNVLNDEFIPDPSKIPLFFTEVDSSRIRKALGTKNKKTVEVEVYKKRLSADAFVAPSTAFFVQPITVEKDFQKEFTSAYRSKSYVSDLNSAYFIYNTPNPEIVAFQQQRFEVLRKAKNYDEVDKQFMKYYTFFPSGNTYNPIRHLADSISKNKNTIIDKVLGVRDYFLARNELGEQIYKYSDNPGIPGLPGASKLLYFLFESKKGYCAYYAASTVFLLRAMNIPSRIVTGFLTVDRSDKNKGWYWFYEDQSHAWVQVFFPEYGWIDFDTTVGNDEAEQSPKPDGTPPMQPPKAVLAANGTVIDVDTLKRITTLRIDKFIFKDVEYNQIDAIKNFDLRIANIWKDSVQIPINLLKPKDHVMAVSYAEKLKILSTENSVVAMLGKLPNEIPTDDIFIKSIKEKEKQTSVNKNETVPKPLTYYMKRVFFFLMAFVLACFLLPSVFYTWLKWKMKRSKTINSKAYYTYRSSIFLLNQLKVSRYQETPLYFAKNRVDIDFDTNFTQFMNTYLKTKYSNQELNRDEQNFINHFFNPFQQKVKSKYKLSTRILYFFNLNQFIHYFQLPELETK